MTKKIWGVMLVAVILGACGSDSSSSVGDKLTDPVGTDPVEVDPTVASSAEASSAEADSVCDDCVAHDDASSSSVSLADSGLSSSDVAADTLTSSSSEEAVPEDLMEVSSSSKSDSPDAATSIVWKWNLSKDDLMNSTVSYGTMSDTRDEKTYKTVTIDSQTWMAENLNYDPGTSELHSVCYGNKSENCLLAGRLYTWSAAIDSVSLAVDSSLTCGNMVQCEMPETIKGICPEGWHLPTQKEWQQLLDYVSDTGNAAKILKAKAGWNYNGNGIDTYGFSVLPAGAAMEDLFGMGSDMFDADVGSVAYFWTASPYTVDNSQAIRVKFVSDSDKAMVSMSTKIERFSVRCIKN